MKIEATIIGRTSGRPFRAIYTEIKNEKGLKSLPIKGTRAYCFYNDKLVIVHESKGHWNLPGGGIEPNENVVKGIHREVKEETNMKILKMKFIGIQEIYESGKDVQYYVRVACLVEPEGDFKIDPGGEVTEIAFIDPSECVSRTDAHWGKIAERTLERALELKEEMLTE